MLLVRGHMMHFIMQWFVSSILKTEKGFFIFLPAGHIIQAERQIGRESGRTSSFGKILLFLKALFQFFSKFKNVYSLIILSNKII